MFHAYFKDFDRAPFKAATAMKCSAPNHAWIRYTYVYIYIHFWAFD
jgi:hypothetical protein